MADFNKVLMSGAGNATIPGTLTATGGITTPGQATAGIFEAKAVSMGTYAAAMTVPAASGCQTLQCVNGTSATSTLTPSGA